MDSLLSLIDDFDRGITATTREIDARAKTDDRVPVQKIPTCGGPLRATFERIARRRGRAIAKVAIARQILTLCYYGLRDGEIRCLKHQPTDDHDNQHLAEAA